jgi:AcrR family transcriptional regulator
MPRVSDEHRDQRRTQILDAAQRCFIRNGFHQTSMQDVLTESGLSAGAVYLYFRGKDDIIAAIADRFLHRVTDLLQPLANQPTPPSTIEVITMVQEAIEPFAFGEEYLARMAPQVWAEALFNPAIQDLVNERFGALYALITRFVRADQNAGTLDPDADADAIATVLFGSLAGYLVQRVVLGRDINAETYRSGLRALCGLQPPGA